MVDPIQPPPWRNSEAKRILHSQIESGVVTADMKPRQVYAMHPMYQLYEKNNFASNLRTMRKEIGFRGNQRAYAEQALRNDLRLANVRTEAARGPRTEGATATPQRAVPGIWGTAVKEQLQADMEAGLHLAMRPAQLHASRPEYQALPLKVFRGHIHQEAKSRKYVNYRKMKSEKKAARRLAAAERAMGGR